ncbi:hypothetical protein BDN71DRAFT_1504569 [Pleurotus eryngii]|uniref:Uncharacterized protein n=1 Tax=Pleurotus eryngii TaxID=5323 RepID=A0A9P6DAU5_PLEER|nr:hypothetical protein BDN71DRAFT_1504569 [Pleurotus eryngii]
MPVQSSAPFYPFNTRLGPVAAIGRQVFLASSTQLFYLLLPSGNRLPFSIRRADVHRPVYDHQFDGDLSDSWANICMARRIRAFLGPAHSQYTGAVAIIVESGLVSTVSMAFITGTFQCDTARWAAGVASDSELFFSSTPR